MFEKVSKNKSKDTLIEESQRDADGYEDKADDGIAANDDAVKKAESLLADVVAPQVQTGGPQVGDQWSAFKPQTNLAPILLDTGASHLEVKKFVESLETYITAGFRGVIPKSGVWIYIAPFLSSSWWASMKSSIGRFRINL